MSPDELFDKYVALWNEGDAVRFTGGMASVDGAVAGLELNFVLLAADGRIRLAYQFIES